MKYLLISFLILYDQALGLLTNRNSRLANQLQSLRKDLSARCSEETSDITDDYLNLNIEKSPLRQMQIRFNCDVMNSEELSELLFECGVLSVSVEGESERPEILNDEKNWADLQRTRSWQTALLRANFPASFNENGLSEILKAAYPNTFYEVTIEPVIDQDWVSEVQKSWKPQIISDLTIRFPWHSLELVTTSMQLVLEGGAAFGTGDHPTTRLCTRWIGRELAKKQDTTILDYGCGSAILGLAALRFGAKSAVGVDIDRDALTSAKNNCELNGLQMKFYLASDSADEDGDDGKNLVAMSETRSVAMNTLRGFNDRFDAVESLDEQFDLVVANILAPILNYLAPALAQYTRPGGKIALSGLVQKQTQSVIAEYSKYFDDVIAEETEEDWVLVTGTKREDTWGEFLTARQERYT